MARKSKTKRARQQKSEHEPLSFTLEAESKMQVTIEAGKSKGGKTPVTIHVDELKSGRPAQVRRRGVRRFINPFAGLDARLRAALNPLVERMKILDVATWLFLAALAVYLITRLIGLTHWPIYFFTDEALQTQFMADLVKSGYHDANGAWFPPAFHNGDYYTLGGAVYMQWLPYLLFGKVAVVTRITSVLITLIAAFSIGIILRDALKIKYWWAGTMFLSITPAWFLHSRTAFEVGEFVAFYSGSLCAYLLYRLKSPRYLYLTLILSALAFYVYSPGQVLVPITSLALAISDWRYHWENRRMWGGGLVLLAVLVIPYLRFRGMDPDNAIKHLHTLFSYWFMDIPLSQKLYYYFTEYFTGMSTWYWYLPNDRDLVRHLMKGYGHILLATLPFALVGLVYALGRVRDSAYRAILIVLIASPVAAAFVAVAITRAMAFVVPAAILTTVGLEQVLKWIENPRQRLAELSRTAAFAPLRLLIAAGLLVVGVIAASVCTDQPDRVTVMIFALMLALQVSGVYGWLARQIKSGSIAAGIKRWSVSYALLAIPLFTVLGGTNIYMLVDALKNGPLWYRDYGLGGMQYGAFQMFDMVKQYMKDHPHTTIHFSSGWANGTDTVARFFLGDPLPLDMGSILGYITSKLPIDSNTLFIMTPDEYKTAIASPKLTGFHVERIVPFPDGTPGFYFVRLRYVDDINAIFEAEQAARAVMQESVVTIDGQQVKVRHSFLEGDEVGAEAIKVVFDGDPYSVTKTFEANPFVIELNFPQPRTLSGFSIIIGSAEVQITLLAYAPDATAPQIYKFEGQGQLQQPQLSFNLPQSITVQALRFEVLYPNVPEPTKVHIWELTLR